MPRSARYPTSHDRMRAYLAPMVAAGEYACCRCGHPILPGQAWHLDHDDGGEGYLGPAHALCNMSAGGRIGARVTAAKRGRVRRVRYDERW